jgi:hypothetical protein
MRTSPFISDDAPISTALVQKLQRIHFEIGAAPAEDAVAVRDAAVWDFFADVIVAIRQLETGHAVSDGPAPR